MSEQKAVKKHVPLHSLLLMAKWKSEEELNRALNSPSFQAALSNFLTQSLEWGAKTDQVVQK